MQLPQILVGLESGHATNGVDAGGNGIHDFVGRGYRGVGDSLVLKLHSVTEAFAVGVLDVALVGAVVFG